MVQFLILYRISAHGSGREELCLDSPSIVVERSGLMLHPQIDPILPCYRCVERATKGQKLGYISCIILRVSFEQPSFLDGGCVRSKLDLNQQALQPSRQMAEMLTLDQCVRREGRGDA